MSALVSGSLLLAGCVSLLVMVFCASSGFTLRGLPLFLGAGATGASVSVSSNAMMPCVASVSAFFASSACFLALSAASVGASAALSSLAFIVSALGLRPRFLGVLSALSASLGALSLALAVLRLPLVLVLLCLLEPAMASASIILYISVVGSFAGSAFTLCANADNSSSDIFSSSLFVCIIIECMLFNCSFVFERE